MSKLDRLTPHKSTALLSLLSCLLAACALPTPADITVKNHEPVLGEEIGTITFVEGEVTIEEPLALTKPPGLAAPVSDHQRTARPYTPVRRGSTISTGHGSRATVVGYNDRVIIVQSRSRIRVNQSIFNNGQSLPANSGRSVTRTSSGHFQVNNGSKQLRGQSREKEADYGNIPIILTPRNTTLLDIAPTITWVGVPGAMEYVLALSSLNAYPEITLEADQLECSDHEMADPSQLCAISWPEEWILEPEKSYFLQISTRTGIASPLRPSEKSRLNTLKVEDSELLGENVSVISALSIDDVTKHVLLGGLYAEYELFGPAIAAYEVALGQQPGAILYVTLGDTYRAIDLNRYAFRAYISALELLDQGPEDLMLRAAARFGQGQVEYSRQQFPNAEPHFQAAVELYEKAGGTDGLEASRLALEETQRRLP